MLKSTVDLSLALVCIMYLRMSSKRQNERSPDQQRDTILTTIKRQNLPWTTVGEYTDSGITGKYLRKRPAFQQMLRDIRSGAIKPDAILVDTFERFGRNKKLDALRDELFNSYGVLLLTADTNFTDPTSVSGRVLGAIESLRATEDNRVKSHNVSRGKRDAVKLRRWPGGPVPFGYKLRSVLIDRGGRQEVDYSVLEPDPDSAWIVGRMFDLAHANSWGSTRVTKALNADPAIPEEYKPFQDATVSFWLRQPIYIGTMVWGEVSTDILDDRRVSRRNQSEDILRVEDFCPPLVNRELFDAYQRLRRARAAAKRRITQADGLAKLIQPTAPGLALRYPLSGLVKCGLCGRAMIASSTRTYTAKDGRRSNYANYVCPGYVSGICVNHRRIPEAWLRQYVFDLMSRRLFGNPS